MFTQAAAKEKKLFEMLYNDYMLCKTEESSDWKDEMIEKGKIVGATSTQLIPDKDSWGTCWDMLNNSKKTKPAIPHIDFDKDSICIIFNLDKLREPDVKEKEQKLHIDVGKDCSSPMFAKAYVLKFPGRPNMKLDELEINVITEPNPDARPRMKM